MHPNFAGGFMASHLCLHAFQEHAPPLFLARSLALFRSAISTVYVRRTRDRGHLVQAQARYHSRLKDARPLNLLPSLSLSFSPFPSHNAQRTQNHTPSSLNPPSRGEGLHGVHVPRLSVREDSVSQTPSASQDPLRSRLNPNGEADNCVVVMWSAWWVEVHQ